MPLVIEDGSVVSQANAYVSLADCDAYLADLEDKDWEMLPNPVREKHIIVGARYVNNTQLYRYVGYKADAAQWMEWPRQDAHYWGGVPAIATTAIPPEIVRANIIAAKLSSAGYLPTETYTGLTSAVRREKVDVVEVQYFHPLDNLSSSGGTGPSAFGSAALNRFGHPLVTGMVAQLLDDDSAGAVSRTDASRRGVYFSPSETLAAFRRGAFDYTPFAEETAIYTRVGDT